MPDFLKAMTPGELALLITALSGLLGTVFGVFVQPKIKASIEKDKDERKDQAGISQILLADAQAIRKELQAQIAELRKDVDHLAEELNKSRRDNGKLRGYIVTVVRDSSISMQLAIGEMENGKHGQAMTRLKRGVEKLETLKMPEEEA